MRVAVTLLLFAGQLWLSHDVIGPIVLPDEIGFLATAAWFAGMDWSGALRGAPFYSFGYPLLLSPGFVLFESPSAVYRFAQVVNALLAAAVFPLAWSVAKRLGGERDGPPAFAAALAVSLYPSCRVYASLALSETALVFLYWSSLLLLLRAADARDRTGRWALFGLALVASYAVHQRFLAVALGGSVLVLLLAVRREMPVGAAIVCLLVIALGTAATWTASASVERLVWAGEVQSLGMESRLAVPGGRELALLGATAAGHAVYLAGASGLLVLVGLGAAFRRALGWLRQPAAATPAPAGVASGFALAGAGSMFLLSVFYLFPFAHAISIYHGRYVEAVTGPLVLLALLAAAEGQTRRTRGFLFALVAFALLLPLPGWLAPEAASYSPWSVSVTAIFPFLDETWRVRAFPAAATAVAVGGITLALWRRAPLAGVLVVGGAWLAIAISNVSGHLAPDSERVGGLARLGAWLEDNADGAPVAFERTRDRTRNALRGPVQFWYAGGRLLSGAPEGSLPGAPYLVTDAPDVPDRFPGALPAFVDRESGMAVWVTSPSEAARLGALGRLRAPWTPSPGGGRLPEAACRSRIEPGRSTVEMARPREPWRTLGDVAAQFPFLRPFVGPREEVRVRASHEGEGAAWPSTVELGLQWLDSTGRVVVEDRVRLPGPLAPGEETSLRVPLVPRTDAGSLLPPGEYRVRLGMVHTRAAVWFRRFGDRVETLRVRLGTLNGASPPRYGSGIR